MNWRIGGIIYHFWGVKTYCKLWQAIMWTNLAKDKWENMTSPVHSESTFLVQKHVYLIEAMVLTLWDMDFLSVLGTELQ